MHTGISWETLTILIVKNHWQFGLECLVNLITVSSLHWKEKQVCLFTLRDRANVTIILTELIFSAIVIISGYVLLAYFKCVSIIWG